MDPFQGNDPGNGDEMGCIYESISNMNISGTKPAHVTVDLGGQGKGSHHGEEDAGENQIYFNPSVCIQRYDRVRTVLLQYLESTGDSPVTLIEFGCAELRLHIYLKHISKRVTQIIYVDKDDSLLESVKYRIRPLAFEYLQKRETPLKVEVYSGDIVQCDPRILNTTPPTFAVIGIELIEHLDPDVLLGFERTVFGLLRPPLVILTTPNSEFNVVFNMAPGAFRHWDHRFEWTRAEFHQWCHRICRQYGGYSYETFGIGSCGEATEHLGCVSQMVVFRKVVEEPSSLRDYSQFSDIIIPDAYRLVFDENYPFFVDTTPRDEKIFNAFKYHIANYILDYSNLQNYIAEQKTEVTLPIDAANYISGLPPNIPEDLEEVRLALIKWGYNLQRNPDTLAWEILLKVPEEDANHGRYWDEDEEEMESENNLTVDAEVRDINYSVPTKSVPGDVDWDNEQW